MTYIVDTHTLLWYLADSPRLSANAAIVFQDAASQLVLPAMAYGEACWIVERGKLPRPAVVELQTALAADHRFTIYRLDREVIEVSQHLTSINEMHDRQIVATALVLARQGEEVAVITRDENITASGVVPVVW